MLWHSALLLQRSLFDAEMLDNSVRADRCSKTCDLLQLYVCGQTDSQAVTAPSGVLIRLAVPTPVIINVALKVIMLIG